MTELHQKEQLSESNKVLIELDPPKTDDSSSLTSVPEIATSFQRIKTEKTELNQQTRDLQLTENDLRNKVIDEIDRRWKTIEYLKSEIITLQKKCNEIPPQIVSVQTLKKTETPIEKIRQKYFMIASLIIPAVLIFYALGIATNFFALPVFSSFFILSNFAAHEVSYVAAAAGLVLIAATVTFEFPKEPHAPLGFELTTIALSFRVRTGILL